MKQGASKIFGIGAPKNGAIQMSPDFDVQTAKQGTASGIAPPADAARVTVSSPRLEFGRVQERLPTEVSTSLKTNAFALK